MTSDGNDFQDDGDVEIDDLVDEITTDPAAASDEDSTESLRELVVFIVHHLVDDPDQAEITADRRGSSVHIQVRLPEDDLGKVIGRGGRIAKAIRTVLLVAGSRHHLRVSLDIEG